MAVKLELYRVFHEVARMGNISAAAQNLFISQSAVSQSIKQLEEQLQGAPFLAQHEGRVFNERRKALAGVYLPRAGAHPERRRKSLPSLGSFSPASSSSEPAIP